METKCIPLRLKEISVCCVESSTDYQVKFLQKLDVGFTSMHK